MPHRRPGRSWGTRFDSLTSSGSLSSNPDSVVASSHHMSSPPSVSADDGNSVQDAHDRVLQDASIFIGSLPTNIEHPELASMLAQHLSGHTQVKGIKVVRDSKGGTCAFIQCQDPEAASMLMSNLHSAPPQPFLGRYLRYEPARAFRTLLISYRSPRQHVRRRDAPRKATFGANEDSRFVGVELPNAMKIIRTPGIKQPSILYDSEALDTTHTGGTDSDLCLVPLLYDAESLFRIACVFGAVDYFGPHAPENECGQTSAHLPPPHDGPRSPVMDPGCWKVKWASREDCVSALVTLRRVPHLTVTWAHQSTSPHGAYNYPRGFPGIQPSHSWRGRFASVSARSAPCFLPASHTFPAFRTTEDSSTKHLLNVNGAEPSIKCNAWQQEVTSASDNKSTLHSKPSRPRALSLTHDRPQQTVSLPSRESTGQLSFRAWESTSRYRRTNHTRSTEFKGSPSMTSHNITSSPYLGHQFSSSDSGCYTSQGGRSQETDASIPRTPDFETSPVASRTPGSLMLRTPTTASYMGDFQSMSFREYESQGSLHGLSQEKREDNTVVDPTTIFVGGLEMYGPNAWDEGKIRALFSKYGGIEAVKVIRPNNKRSAFAFVKFNNTEAPMRAISGEHNRMHDGRLIRVQLRDWNPAYRSWKSGPNKEFGSQPLSTSDSYSVDSKQLRPNMVNIAAHMEDLQCADSPAPLAQCSVSACELNEVQDETRISPRPLSADVELRDGLIQEARQTEILVDIQGDVILDAMTPSVVPTPVPPGPYSTPTLQFYQGWIPNFASQFPYPIPFTGQPYPGYPFLPPMVAPPPQNGGSDGSGTSSPAIPIVSTGGPYPAFLHYPPLGHSSDPSQAPAGHLHAHAPLIPTGFIQGDQGMLVPVYPPDALNQYMAGNQDQGQAPTNSGPSEGQAPATWRSYPPPPIRPAVIFHPYINPPLAAPPHHLGAQWVSGHPWHGVAAQLGNPHGGPGRRITPSPASTPAPLPMGSGFERNMVPPRRQYRRDNHSQHHKNNISRGPIGRFGKASFDAPRSPTDIQLASVPQIAAPDASADTNWQR